MGDYSNSIICIDNICKIESYEVSSFSGTCICQINSDFNSLKSNNINFIKSEKNNIDSYEISLSIFKCIKSGFNINILSNTGFYIFTIFIFFQTLSFLFFICFEKKNLNFFQKKSLSNPPKKEFDNEILFIENFDIIETINNNNNSFECSEKIIQDKDEGEIIEDINSYSMEYEDSVDINKEKESIMTNIKSEIGIINKINSRNNKSNNLKLQIEETNNPFIEKEKEVSKNYNNNNIKHQNKKIKENKFMSINESDINIKYKDILSLNNRKKTKSQHKISDFNYTNTEINERIKHLGYTKKTKRKNINNGNITNNSIRSKEELINLRDKISSIKKSIICSPDNLSFEKAKNNDNLSFCGFYWYLLGLKQPLLNLTSQIKLLNITESFVPSGIKLIRFFFLLGLNFFINSLFISQKYFSAKFKYFDNKYNLRFNHLGNDISINERFSYAFKHTILFAVYTFLICYVIQAIINYFYFNLRKTINVIIVNNSNVEEEIKDYLDTVRTKYQFIFMINIILMLLFWYYIINFSAVYTGGDLDYIAASILTFVFLQIFPFFICFFLARIRYCGLKKSEENIYKFSQVFAF